MTRHFYDFFKFFTNIKIRQLQIAAVRWQKNWGHHCGKRSWVSNILIISKGKNCKIKWLEPLQRTKDYKNLIDIPIQENRTKIVSINKEQIPSQKSLK